MTRHRWLALVATASIAVAACGGTSNASPGASGGAASGGTSPSTSTAPGSQAPTGDQSLTMVMDADLSGGLSNAADNVPAAKASLFLYDALYDYDEGLIPVPKLVEDLATVSDDGLTWTVKLKPDIKFHDGTDLTAEDVVQTYELAASENCRYNPSICLTAFLEKVEAVDDLTVSFTLTQKLATFATVFLPAILIESKDAIDASYARYVEGTRKVTETETKALLEKVAAEEANPTGPAGEDGKPTVNWEALIPELEAFITKAGQELPDKAVYTTDGVLDTALYGTALKDRVTAIDATYTLPAVDALAAAYPYLDFQFDPVGTGPWKFAAFKPGESIELTANEDYFLGAPIIKKVLMPIIKDDLVGGQALAAGQADWKYSLEGSTYNEIKDNPNLKFVEYPDFGFFALYFNQREGTLFADKNLRQAVSYCFDKEGTAAAATDNQGVAIYSEIPPASWAYPTEGINKYPMDAAKGKALIEQSGWTVGSDGIYEKAGQKLATTVAVRAGRPNRSKWMQLMSDQVKQNCGIDFQYKEVDFAGILNMLDVFPHINAAAPEKAKPFDAYFGGFDTTYDPDPYSLYHSKECSTAERPTTFNYICYSNPEVDKLIDEGLTTLDQAERAKIYQEYAILQAEDLPVIYAWADIRRQGLSASVDTTAEGGLQMDSPQFFWKFHQLTNAK
jgi:ABC-type transport system substrate-binding protein